MALFYYFVILIPKPLIIGSDFTAYLTGAQIIKEGKGNLLYDLKSQLKTQQEIIQPFWSYEKGLLPFRYLPFVGVFFLPFTFFNLILGFKLFATFNLFLVILFILLSAKFFKNINQHKIWLLVPLIFIPVFHTISLGQTSLILTLSLLLIYQSIKSKKPFTAGLLCGLLLFKPQYLTILPFLFLLTNNKQRFIFGILLSFLALLSISIWTSGLDTLLKYPSLVLSTETPFYGARAHQMFSLNTLLSSPALSLSPFKIFIINGLLYLFFLLIFIKRHKSVSFDQSFASATIFSLLFAIHVLSQDLVLLLVPAYLMANHPFILLFTLILISLSAAVLKGGLAVLILLLLAIGLLFYQNQYEI